MILVLGGITLFAGITLASVYSLTKDKTGNSQLSKIEGSIRAVLPPYDHISLKPVEMNNGVETTHVYQAYDKNNTLVGAAVESTSNNGYIGQLDIMVGFDKLGNIVNYVVIDQHETPGLGAKMEDWFKSGHSNQDIRGKNAGMVNLTIRKDGGEIDGITGATISSRAFLFAIRNAYFAFSSNIDSKVTDSKDTANSTQGSAENDSISNDTVQPSSKNVMKGSHK